MSVTMKARAGFTLRARVGYLQPDGSFVDTTGSTAKLIMRTMGENARTVLSTSESETEGATLQLLEPGSWRIFLSGALTKTLPETVAFEVNLINDTNSDDKTPLASGVILTGPQVGG